MTGRALAFKTTLVVAFRETFRNHEFKLSLDVESRAKNAVAGKTAVRELEKFCRNPIQC